MKTLIARWVTNEDATIEPPHMLQWADGTPATLADYRKHLDDTHKWILHPPSIIERHVFPDIVADVRYDAAAGVWAVGGDGVQSAALGLNDPNAADDEILEELYTFPVIYRARIHR